MHITYVGNSGSRLCATKGTVVLFTITRTVDTAAYAGFYSYVVPQIMGFHHVTIPTVNASSSSDWYVRVFGFATVLVAEEENGVVAVLLEHPSGVRLYLRQAPEQATALRGIGILGLAVPDRACLLQWAQHLTGLGVDHGNVHWAHLGWALTVVDLNGMRIQLHTRETVSSEDI